MARLKDQLANSFASRCHWLGDDIKSVATLSLYELLQRIVEFDSVDHLVKFANTKIRGAILNFIGSECLHAKRECKSATYELTTDLGVISKSELDELTEKLTAGKEEALVLSLRLQGYTDDEIALKLKRSRPYVSDIRRRIGNRYEQQQD